VRPISFFTLGLECSPPPLWGAGGGGWLWESPKGHVLAASRQIERRAMTLTSRCIVTPTPDPSPQGGGERCRLWANVFGSGGSSPWRRGMGRAERLCGCYARSNGAPQRRSAPGLFVGHCRRSHQGRSYGDAMPLIEKSDKDTSGRPGLLIWRTGGFPPRVDAQPARTFRHDTSRGYSARGPFYPHAPTVRALFRVRGQVNRHYRNK